MYTKPEELRQRRADLLKDKTAPYIAVIYSGNAPRTSADGAHHFHVDRKLGTDPVKRARMLAQSQTG